VQARREAPEPETAREARVSRRALAAPSEERESATQREERR